MILYCFCFLLKVINNDFDGCEKIIEQASKGKIVWPTAVSLYFFVGINLPYLLIPVQS